MRHVSSNRIISQPIWQRRLNFLKVSEVRFGEEDLWPSNLPDLNPLDHYFYAQIEAIAFDSSRNSITVLNEDIKKAVRSLEMTEMTHEILNFSNQEKIVWIYLLDPVLSIAPWNISGSVSMKQSEDKQKVSNNSSILILWESDSF